MNSSLKIASAVLLLMLGTANALAEPGHNRRDEREARREEQAARRQARQGQNAQVPDAIPETPKKRGMTPEERRALRRQIHDAGRDIYSAPNAN